MPVISRRLSALDRFLAAAVSTLLEMVSMRNEGLVTLKQAAEFLAVSEGRVKVMVYEEKTLPSVKLGRSRRIKWSDLQKFVEGLHG